MEDGRKLYEVTFVVFVEASDEDEAEEFARELLPDCIPHIDDGERR